MSNILGCIFARGGSKGLPGKNIRRLCGRPLIAHAITTALQTRFLERVIVSTDDVQIAAVARHYGGQIPFMRPAELASDTAPERLAWRHAIETMEQLEGRRIDVLVSIPATCPLRSVMDVDRCVERLLQSDADIVVTAAEATSNPYFNMITLDKDEIAHIAVKPPANVSRRQDAPTVYDLTAVAYAARRDAIFSMDSYFQGRVRAVIVPKERAIDIDTEFDFQLAEFLMNRNYRPPTYDGESQAL